MKKWYISENGNVSGPFDLSDIKKLVSKEKDLYGWNPSFKHWLPVSQIGEFQDFLPESNESNQISEALIEKFVSTKRDLSKKLSLIDDSIESTVKSMNSFDDKITYYKELTNGLAPEVKDNIFPLEKKYNSLNKQLDDLEKAAVIAKKEISDTVVEFDELVLDTTNKNAKNSSTLAFASTPKVLNDFKSDVSGEVDELSVVENVKSIKPNVKAIDEPIPSVQPVKNVVEDIVEDSVKTKRNTAPKNITNDSVINKQNTTPKNVINDSVISKRKITPQNNVNETGINRRKNSPSNNIDSGPKPFVTAHPFDQRQQVNNKKKMELLKDKPKVELTIEESEKSSFSDVKSKFKSVFGQQKPDRNESDKISDELKKLEKEVIDEGNEDEEFVFIDSEDKVEADATKKRRRKRRF